MLNFNYSLTLFITTRLIIDFIVIIIVPVAKLLQFERVFLKGAANYSFVYVISFLLPNAGEGNLKVPYFRSKQ